ncbi:hypothetical protein J3E69DRAFT_56292 [Trichoderma sp. SZMC 28015]
MSENPTTNGHDALEEKLGRLARKPGIKASLVLDRATGAILKTSGQIDALQTAKSRNASTAASFSNDAPAAEEGEAQGVEEFAEMIWNFVNSSGQLVGDIDTEVERGYYGDNTPPLFVIACVNTAISQRLTELGRTN